MSENPSYYSILTANVRYDPRLKNYADCKILYSEITALSNKYGYCTASNRYFANLYGRSKKTISKWINLLKDCGYLRIQQIYKHDSREVIERRIYVLSTPIPSEKDRYPLESGDPIPPEVKDNITRENKERDYKKSKIKNNDITNKDVVDMLLDYYAIQSNKWRSTFPDISYSEKIVLGKIIANKDIKDLYEAVDKTVIGATDYPVGYLIKCIKNLPDRKSGQS